MVDVYLDVREPKTFERGDAFSGLRFRCAKAKLQVMRSGRCQIFVPEGTTVHVMAENCEIMDVVDEGLGGFTFHKETGMLQPSGESWSELLFTLKDCTGRVASFTVHIMVWEAAWE